MYMRRYTYKLDPTPTQAAGLDRWRRMTCWLFNACIEQRRDAWDRCRKSLSKFDQQREATALAQSDPYWRELPSSIREKAVERVEQAYKKYFDNVKLWRRGQWHDKFPPHPPGFKKSDLYPGFGLREHGHGWKVRGDLNLIKRGKVYIQGVGEIRFHGELPRDCDDIRNADVQYKSGQWWLSIAVKFEELGPMRGPTLAELPAEASKWLRKINGLCVIRSGDREIAGHTQARRAVAEADSRSGDREIAGHTQATRPAAFSRPGYREITGKKQKRFRPSRGAKCRKVREDNERKRRDYWLHKLTTAIAKDNNDITIERPPLREATKSARGTAKDPGAMVEFKAQMNRDLLDRGIGKFTEMLKEKIEARGGTVHVVDKPDELAANEVVQLAKTARKARRIVKRVKKCA